jgi:hypothetical protein
VGTLIESARTLAVPSRAAVVAELPPAPSEACPATARAPRGQLETQAAPCPIRSKARERLSRGGVNFNTLPLRGVLWTVPMSS